MRNDHCGGGKALGNNYWRCLPPRQCHPCHFRICARIFGKWHSDFTYRDAACSAFDRTADGDKLHMQSLCALAHYDFNAPGTYSYEQALLAIRRLGLPMDAVEEQFRRMVFNILARNQDDHVKNIAFLMDRRGHWSLSPAFDVSYCYNPAGPWTSTHQMSMNGKRDDFTREDFHECARSASIKRGRENAIFDEVRDAVLRWPEFAATAGLSEKWSRQIGGTHRRDVPAA